MILSQPCTKKGDNPHPTPALLLLLNMVQLKSMELHGWVEEVTGPNNSLVFIYLPCPSGSLNFTAAIISKQPVEEENAILEARIKGKEAIPTG